MASISTTSRKTSRLRRACANRSSGAGKPSRRLVLEHLEGRDLPAPLTVLPTTLETSVGAPNPFLSSPLTAVTATFVPPSAGLSSPFGLAFDVSGNLYVSNYYANTLSQVTPAGTITTFVAASAGLSNPTALAFDSSGNLYVANTGNNTVSEVTPSGTVTTFVPASAGLSGPFGLAFDSSGNLYVANRNSNTVSEVTDSGIVTTFVPSSAGLSTPEGLAFDSSDNLYVASYGNNSIDKVTTSGIVTTFVPSSAGLSSPGGLAFASNGDLYVANMSDSTIREVTPSGAVTTFLSASSGLSFPDALAFDSTGSLYVAGGNGSVLKIPFTPPTFAVSDADAGKLAAIGLSLNPDGTFSGTVTSLPSPNPLTFTALATNSLGDSGSAVITVEVTQPVINPTSLETGVGATPPPLTMTGQGNVLTTFNTHGEGLVIEQAGLAIDSGDNLYVGDTDRAHIVQKITPDGTASLFVPEISDLTDPQALTVDRSGNLFVAYSAGQLLKVTPNGAASPVNFGFSNPDGLAFDGNGNLYVADAGNNTVTVMTPSGAFSTFVPASAGLSHPTGLAFDSSGNLYVSNLGTGTISKVTSGGTVTTFVPASAGLDFPTDLAFDSSGNLYVSNKFNNTVSKVTLAGVVSTLIPASAGLFDPVGLAFDSKGFLFIVNQENHLISKWGPAAASFAISATDASKLSAIGLTLQANGAFSGTITGIPSPNPLTFTVTATDALGDWSTAQISLTVDPTPHITSAGSATFTVGAASSFAVTVTGLPTPTVSETGALPSGVTFDASTLVLGGTPAAGTAGAYPITFTASNGVGGDATQNFTLTVNQAPAITSADSVTFQSGEPNSFTVTATGSPAPTLSMTGILPAGITFDASTGVLSGITEAPPQGGVYPLTITASNGVGSDATQSFTLTMDEEPDIFSTNTTFVAGTFDSYTLVTSGFPIPTYSEVGAFPAGVSFNSTTGVISGTAAVGTGGAYPITFTASNGIGSDFTRNFTLTVGQAPAITSAASATFTVGGVGSFTVMATGFPAPTFSEVGALPSGFSLNAGTGVLSGTPSPALVGIYPILITVTNGIGSNATQNFTLTVNQAPTITSAASTTFIVTSLNTFKPTVTGFPSPTLIETGNLPGGVVFNTGVVILAGTPDAGTGGIYPITFMASNGVGNDATQNFTLTVDEPSTITSAASATFTVGSASSFSFTATGFPNPTLSEVGTLPAGVNFNASTGVLGGTPDAGSGGIYPITIKAINGVLADATQNFLLTVDEAPAITSAASTTFTVGAIGSFTPTLVGFPSPVLSETGALPSGVSFNASTGVLGGTPDAGTSGNYPITFTASNGILSDATQNFTLTVGQAPAITSASSTTFTTGTPGSFALLATGFPSPVFGEIGELPSGVSFNTSTGVLSGKPNAGTGGIYAITFTANNGVGSGVTQNFTLTVNQAPVIRSPASWTFTVGRADSFLPTLLGFPSPTLSETGTLPSGVSFNASTGLLGGTPDADTGGIYPITFTASNGVGNNAVQNFTLTVDQAPAITSATSATFAAGAAASFTVTATGFPSPAFSETGALPSGVSFNASTGVLGGMPAAGTAGNYAITFTASNVAGSAVSGTFTLTVTQIGGIGGVLFRDFNLDGLQDDGEPALAGQTVYLDLNNNGALDAGEPTATTDANGAYTFTGLAPGVYTVRQVLLGGVLVGAPSSASYSLTVIPGSGFTNQNFADILTSIAVPLTLPPNSPFPALGNANADYVEAIYRAVLNRNADAGGLSSWTGELNAGTSTRLQVVQGIRNSPEHFGQEVDALYQTLLGRAADSQGRAYWVQQLENGVREEQITFDFLNSPEYLGKGDKFFVDAMYQSLLGRSFDPTGEANWLNALGDDSSGQPTHAATLTHAQVINDFLFSSESLGRLVEGYYAVFLQRQADPGDLSSWVAQLQQGLPFLTIGQEFIASDEFFNKAVANH